jgi:hypothetical protein
MPETRALPALSAWQRWRLSRPSSARRRLQEQLYHLLGEAPGTVMPALKALIAEADLHSFNARRSSSRWSRAYYWLGLPAAVLAAVAGATGLTSTAGRLPAAYIALVAAGLTAAATFLDSNAQRQRRDALSAAWQELADVARMELIRFGEAVARGDTGANRRYYTRALALHRWKGQLLRGDLSSPPPLPEPVLPGYGSSYPGITPDATTPEPAPPYDHQWYPLPSGTTDYAGDDGAAAAGAPVQDPGTPLEGGYFVPPVA